MKLKNFHFDTEFCNKHRNHGAKSSGQCDKVHDHLAFSSVHLYFNCMLEDEVDRELLVTFFE